MSIKGFTRMRSNMAHDFGHISSVKLPRSVFRRDHSYKTTFGCGTLIPFYCDEALPGDTFSVNVASVIRMTTCLVPFMDNIHIDWFFFSVPNRLLWQNWKKFMGEQVDPGDSTDYTVPQVTEPVGGWTTGSLGDYMGVPILVDPCPANALHFRAYNRIYNEWFRSEDLTDSEDQLVGDGPDAGSSYPLLRRTKRHDYFTSCLPWPEKNGDEVDISLGLSADVKYDDPIAGTDYSDNWVVYGPATSGPDWKYGASKGVNTGTLANSETGNLYADLSDASTVTINELREAFQLQKLLERDARGGTRYTEIIKSHFSVDSPDARQQRPEYLGGGSSILSVTPIPQTSESSGTDQGTLAAVGYHTQAGVGFTKSFTEHCCIIGIVNARADISYQQGLERMWSRQTKYDFYWPALAFLGEQEVLNKEIYAQGDANDDLVFGYNERWSEYRTKPNLITGRLRSTSATSLDWWHLAEEFSSLPVLNTSFIESNPPVARVVADSTEPAFVMDAFIRCRVARCMPVFSTPGLIDHF